MIRDKAVWVRPLVHKQLAREAVERGVGMGALAEAAFAAYGLIEEDVS